VCSGHRHWRWNTSRTATIEIVVQSWQRSIGVCASSSLRTHFAVCSFQIIFLFYIYLLFIIHFFLFFLDCACQWCRFTILSIQWNLARNSAVFIECKNCQWKTFKWTKKTKKFSFFFLFAQTTHTGALNRSRLVSNPVCSPITALIAVNQLRASRGDRNLITTSLIVNAKLNWKLVFIRNDRFRKNCVNITWRLWINRFNSWSWS